MTTIRIEGDGFVYDYDEYRVIEDACFYAELEREDTLDELAKDTRAALISFAVAMGAVIVGIGVCRITGVL